MEAVSSQDPHAPEAPPDATLQEGEECAVQTLYEGRARCTCCTNWVEEYPRDLRVAVEQKPEVKKKALVARMRKNHDGGEGGRPLVLDSVVVHSASLKKTLAEVFQGYDGITPTLKKVVFRSPFRPFYYRWKLFEQILERQRREDPAAAAHSQLLHDVLGAKLADTMAELEDHLAHGVISAPLLWTLFEPGTRVVAKLGGESRFFIVDSCKIAGDGSLALMVRFVDWDGQRFGYAKGMLSVPRFSGTRAIRDLNVHPAKFLLDQEKTEAEAIARGRKFESLRGFHHMAYSGMVRLARTKEREVNLVYRSTRRDPGQRMVDGRIVVDAETFFRETGDASNQLEPLDKPVTPRITVTDKVHGGGPVRTHTPQLVMTDPLGQMRDEDGAVRQHIKTEELSPNKTKESVPALLDEQALLCHNNVRGYCLKSKSWAEFEVTGIRDITYNDAAFPNLMLPAGYKNLILSFVDGQARSRTAFDDVIEGKGQGVIMLLTGNPGIGKTLTVEAVADKLRKPLYVLSAGELGQKGHSVESRLTQVFELSERWDGVLLFDECDVFLQERSSTALGHNEVVAVFLRLLEYYRGILIMTTNRADAIDRAFQSRIHLTLHYPDLDPAAKEHVWRQFVATSSGPDHDLDDGDFQRLSLLPMNGREIKNVVKVATLLASQEQTTLGLEQIRTVLRATRGGEYDSLSAQ
ncbi:hypothetical protein CPLU01_04484 [Colletotrichum plurivorum]|uniref:AAA+ ATPase domain-containing protein n=1 Tax=Colletotrichum plurivorum TaxID=2175906 RepID=A0A8H6KPA1_9PEZI|nr:hypothetical protein CPLU01_04484 [Colletotrichum plurivorum]